MAKRKTVPPEVRGDRPVISIRVPADLKQHIAEHLRATGKTYTEWVTELFEGQQDHAREVEEAYDRGFRDCSRWLARLYLEDEDQFGAVFGGLVWLVENEQQATPSGSWQRPIPSLCRTPTTTAGKETGHIGPCQQTAETAHFLHPRPLPLASPRRHRVRRHLGRTGR